MIISSTTIRTTTKYKTAAVLTAFLASTAASSFSTYADINATGDVDPVYDGTTDPWGTFRLYVGRDGVGTLNIFNAGVVNTSFGGYVGFNTGSNGTVAVTDAGSQWNNSRDLYVGYNGTGLLNIQNSALVSVSRTTWTGFSSGSGTISFNNGTLTTIGLNASSNSLLGTGTINTGGIVSDVNLVFNAGTGLQQQVILNSLPGQNITLNVDASLASSSDMGAGYEGIGSLTIDGGVVLNNRTGYLGYKSGSNGTATVTGAGSAWTNTSRLFVGYEGTGTLNIQNGGVVSSSDGYLGIISGSSGTATVDGVGSQWNNTDDLFVGSSGTGTLNIQNGGAANTAGTTSTGFSSGSGTINFNSGTLNTAGLFAGSNSLLGTGTVNTNTLVSDLSLTFNAGSGLQQQVTLNSLPGQNVTLNIDASVEANNEEMGAGYEGTGSLNIEGGVQLASTSGYLGFKADSDGTASITGANSRWDNTSSLYVGRDGDGTLHILSGAVVSSVDGHLGQNAVSTGVATIDGIDSEWNNSDELFVGNSGTGILNIQDGGKVTAVTSYLGNNAGSSGTATVTGTGSQWTTLDEFYVGRNANGTLNIQNGGRVIIQDGGASVDNDTYIGTTTGVTGTVNVTGTGSELFVEDDRSEFYIGDAGTADLSIQSSGKVTSSWDAFIGNGAGSTGTVTIDGAGSEWNNERVLEIGVDGIGSIDIVNGALLSNGSSTSLGRNTTGNGLVTVDGTGSQWDQDGNLNLGITGTGTVNIQNGGVIDVSSSVNVGSSTNSLGIMTVDGVGSQLNIDSQLKVSQDGIGTLNILNGGVVNSSILTTAVAQIGVAYDSFGSIIIDGIGSQLNQNRDLQLGVLGSGMLTIQNGAVAVIGGNLLLETAGGNAVLQFGVSLSSDPLLDVMGDASLAGTIGVALDSGVTLTDGDQFTLIEIDGTQSGLFDNVAEGGLLGTYGGFDLFLTYTGGDGNDVVAFAAVPEPSSFGIFAFGSLALLKRRRSAFS